MIVLLHTVIVGDVYEGGELQSASIHLLAWGASIEVVELILVLSDLLSVFLKDEFMCF